MEQILFVCSGIKNKQPGPIIESQADSLAVKGLEIDFFIVEEGGFRGYVKAIPALRKKLKKKQFAIIHAHYGLCGIISLLAKRKEKLIVSFMGDDIVGTNKPDGSITLVSKLISLINVFLARNLYNHIIVKSAEMFHRIGKTENISLIPNGIDITKFKYINRSEALGKTGFKNENINILFVADPSRPEKNFRLAIAATNVLNDPKIEIHTVNGVHFDLLVNYYNAADVLIMTSFHEGSPNVVKEAMACNCPVVSTNVGDVEWLFKDTEGYYLATYDPQDFADKITKAIHFRQFQGQTNGHKRIMELGLDSETIAKKITSVYKDLLSAQFI